LSYLVQTINPENPTGDKIDVIITEKNLDYWFAHKPVKFQNLITCGKQVLANPKRIYRGLRELSEGGWCYVGKPDTWFLTVDQEVPFPNNKVFALFVNDRMYLYDFVAELCDPEDPISIINWRTRFGGRVWSS
jgi:hypothetical protein